ncbi:myotrophin-like [Biomphalaria glabrata]|uniref:Myotrophin-like n=1 Tax=Biomphalaria glabrata TaxID=6526 RepID=A0A9W3BM99_BIOGL|nr:myotrophin-like [Biomphalaria glabrata]KAI8760884.1 myotrophin [Biomphalaria glabrata]
MSDGKDQEFVWKVKNGELNDIKTFVEKEGVDVNKQIQGRFPLHFAADYGQTEVLEYLLSKGAKINEPDKFGITPLLSAIYEGHTASVQVLLAKGADKTGKSPDGLCYIDCAEKDEIKALLK